MHDLRKILFRLARFGRRHPTRSACMADQLLATAQRLQKRRIQRQWIAACRHDHVDPRAAFIVFSPDNPYR